MRIMPTVKFGDRFGIAFFGIDQYTLLEMCLELALQRDEERGAIVTVPIGEAAWYDLGVVDLNLHLRVARQRGIHRIEQQVAVESKSSRHHPIQLEFQFLVVVGCVHGCPRFAWLNLAHSEYDLSSFVEMLDQRPLRVMCGRLRVGKAFLTSAALVGAAMCSAFECGSHDRWP